MASFDDLPHRAPRAIGRTTRTSNQQPSSAARRDLPTHLGKCPNASAFTALEPASPRGGLRVFLKLVLYVEAAVVVELVHRWAQRSEL